jgi:hypothetical protein
MIGRTTKMAILMGLESFLATVECQRHAGMPAGAKMWGSFL